MKFTTLFDLEKSGLSHVKERTFARKKADFYSTKERTFTSFILISLSQERL